MSCMGLGVIILLTAGGRLIAGKKKAADTAQNTQQETIEEQTAVLTEVTANIDSDVTEQGKGCGENRIGRFRHIGRIRYI